MKKTPRRIISLLLTLVLAVACCIAGAVAGALRPGDVDGSGKVNSADARLVLRAAARVESLTGERFTAADVDGNGKIAAADARIILRAAARLEALPAELPNASGGVWKLIDTRVSEKRQPNSKTDIFVYDASEGQHSCSMKHLFDDGSDIYVAYRGVCTEMPRQIVPGAPVVAELKLWIIYAGENNTSGHYTAEAYLCRDVPGLALDTFTEKKVEFSADREGGDNRCVVDSPGKWLGKHKDTEFVRVYDTFPVGTEGEQWSVYFVACGSETVWTYEWEMIEEPTEPTTEMPVEPTTEPQIEPTTEMPIEPTTEPPVEPTTEMPIEPTTEMPIEPTTEPPIEPTTEPPVEPTAESGEMHIVSHISGKIKSFTPPKSGVRTAVK